MVEGQDPQYYLRAFVLTGLEGYQSLHVGRGRQPLQPSLQISRDGDVRGAMMFPATGARGQTRVARRRRFLFWGSQVLDNLLTVFRSPWDVAGFILFLIVFPLYHGIYPLIAAARPNQTARGRIDALRRSWIERLLAGNAMVAGAQQTRNLTMVNSILVSSALILMGVTANLLFQLPTTAEALPHPSRWDANPDAVRMKLYLLILIFASAFSFCMAALRHLGQFVLVIGSDPKIVEKFYGDAPQYFTDLINRASHRYTLGIRSFHAAFPIVGWLFDSRLFFFLSLVWGLKFFVFQDFARKK